MPKPTPEQLQKINRFTQVPLTEDNVYVFKNMLIDDQRTSYFSRIHERLLGKFLVDVNKGVALLMNHNSRQLPVGRSFDGRMVDEYSEDGKPVKSLYGDFYIDLGRKTESNMTTNDVTQGIDAGTIFDTSIGFNANRWTCSICGNDIRDWRSCVHYPGEKYVVSDDGEDEIVVCEVIVGEDGEGELVENSLVYAGACNRAAITQNFSKESVTELEKSPKLHLIDDFKNIPVGATIYQYYTKDGSVLFTDTAERTDGAKHLLKRSEEKVELQKIIDTLSELGITFASPEELATAVKALSETPAADLAAKDAELAKVSGELATASADLEIANGELSKKDETITELTKANEELAGQAELAKTYRQDLKDKCLELGVRAQGNAFNSDLYGKFIDTLSIDELKGAIDGFDAEVKARFEGSRISDTKDPQKRLGGKDPQHKDDFASDIEFRDFVATKATEYAKENSVSISEATKLMYAKYSTKEADGSDK